MVQGLKTVRSPRTWPINMSPLQPGTLCLFALLSIGSCAAAAGPTTDPTVSPVRRIGVALNRIKGPLNRAFRFSIGSDRAIIHLRPEHQRDLRFLKQTCGFAYMRFHGLLNEEMHVVKTGADGAIVYDWTNVDGVYDFLVRDLKI